MDPSHGERSEIISGMSCLKHTTKVIVLPHKNSDTWIHRRQNWNLSRKATICSQQKGNLKSFHSMCYRRMFPQNEGHRIEFWQWRESYQQEVYTRRKAGSVHKNGQAQCPFCNKNQDDVYQMHRKCTTGTRKRTSGFEKRTSSLNDCEHA